MTVGENEKPKETPVPPGVYEQCPHCGQKLSPWEQVLLNVDRALLCKRCWYRIIMPVSETPGKKDKGGHQRKG